MRKLLILPLVLLAGYLAWPVAAAWQLRAAVKARDAAAIESKVDWATLRANLKQTIGANLKEAGENPERGAITKALIRALGAPAAGAVIDLTVTPQTLARVLAGRSMLDDLGMTKRKDAPLTSAEEDEEAASDPLSPRRLRWAFFETPLRFRIETVDRHLPGKRIVSILALQGASWKLVDVYYITPT